MRTGSEPAQTRWIAARIAFVALLLAAGFVAVSAQAVKLRVVQGAQLTRHGDDQWRRFVELRPRRGPITDRNGQTLAASADAPSVAASPHALSQLSRRELSRLARALAVDAGQLEKKAQRPTKFVWLKRRVSPEEAKAVQALDLEGVGLFQEPRRYYPAKSLAAQLVGLVGDDGDGLEGIEKAYEDALQGDGARVASVRDARGRAVLDEAPAPEALLAGAKVELAIDANLQHAAEHALGKAVAQAHAAGALRAGDAIDCEQGSYRIGGHVIHDHKALGWAGPSRIVAMSSNIGAAKIGARLGRERLQKTLLGFGFGARTGTEVGGEPKGAVPYPQAEIALATMSFGQGVAATPLQITNAVAAIANGGTLMKPILVRKVVDTASGAVLSRSDPTPLRRAVSRESAALLTRWLEGVVRDPDGTGKRARLEGWRVAGKTGTAQKADPVTRRYSVDKRFSSFVGFAPAEAPRIAVGVFIDEPRGEVYGGEVAAPVFRDLVEHAMKSMGGPPSGVDASPALASAGAAPSPPPSPLAGGKPPFPPPGERENGATAADEPAPLPASWRSSSCSAR